MYHRLITYKRCDTLSNAFTEIQMLFSMYIQQFAGDSTAIHESVFQLIGFFSFEEIDNTSASDERESVEVNIVLAGELSFSVDANIFESFSQLIEVASALLLFFKGYEILHSRAPFGCNK